MQKLEYIIEDSTIAEILGVQNFKNEESAVLELVKNAYDAQSPIISIDIYEDCMVIEDKGKGMDRHSIMTNWMHIGKSNKGYEVGEDEDRRVLAGSKGVGRFALARLGEQIELFSKMEGQSAIVWKTDWSSSTLEDYDKNMDIGTKIIIKGLRDNWTENRVNNLRDFLSKTYNDTKMKIELGYHGAERKEIKKYFGEYILGLHGVSAIKLFYHAETMSLTCEIESDEFTEKAKKYCEGMNIHHTEITLNMYDELEGKKIDNLFYKKEELTWTLRELGDFQAELYFSLKPVSVADAEKFCYKYRFLENRYDEGVVLYRNAFSISTYEGKKDWLTFGIRSRKSPAAASHNTGAWRVRENQIAGKVIIDKKENVHLTDLANRQGLVENDSYKLFVEIIIAGIAVFERYRQNIIRNIVKGKSDEEKERKKPQVILNSVIKNPERLNQLSPEEKQTFIGEVKDIKKENTENKKQMNEKEERYRYDIRLLNTFATSGLKATSIAHDMHSNRNSISENIDRIISALKRYDVWEIVCDEENRQYAFCDIPSLLEKNRRLNKKLVTFMDVMLSESEKGQFKQEENIDVYAVLKEIKEVWERDYSWSDIHLNVDKGLTFKSARDIFQVIFDNLILNSIQQNDSERILNIYIEINKKDNCLEIDYKDDGVGLPPKYREEPMRIVEVHETSRANGHGIGMWIVRNTLLNSKGDIVLIEGKKGFHIKFLLGDKV